MAKPCRRASLAMFLLVAGLSTRPPSAAAQAAPPTEPAPAVAATAVEQTVQAGPPAPFTYANRPIVQFRSSVFGRLPAERATAARLVLDRLVEDGVMGPVEARMVDEVMVISVGGRQLFAIVASDVDALTGETLAETGALAVSRLQTALDEVAELRRPRQLLVALAAALIATAVFVALIWLLVKMRRTATRRLSAAAEKGLRATVVGDEDFIRSTRILEALQGAVTFAVFALGLLFTYFWLTFTLRRFPYTRPWGESLRAFLFDQLSHAGDAILQALPRLFPVLLIVLLTRIVTRFARLLFLAVEDGRISLPGVYRETAEPTRKIVNVALWLFAVAIAYPFFPASESDAFKGVSVFVGLMVSLGSSGLVNQVMSGFTLTYSRALRVGDFVGVGNVEGTVEQVGTLSTKIKTPRGEDVTIPNAVVVSQTVTNYSRFAETEGVFVPTSITIGYDVPWRQVNALLLLAVSRTRGVCRDPAPVVMHAALEDPYVKYTLLFCPERPAERRKTLSAVHANILDAFNEFGVQITSPRYEADPKTPKVVPRDRWFTAPAAPETSLAPSSADDQESPGRPPK